MIRLPAHLGITGTPAACVDGVQELVKCFGKQLHSLSEKVVSDRLQRDADVVKGLQCLPRCLDTLLQRGARPAMITKSIHRGRRHRVDRVRANQFLHVKHVAVARVLRAGAGPQ